MAVTKSDAEHEYAACVFLKWFTQKEQNLRFVCNSGYMPVKKDPISRGKIEQWDRYIQILDGLDILELLQKLELPPDGTGSDSESDLSMLPEQRLGSYIRELLTS